MTLKESLFVQKYFYFANATEAVMHVYNVRSREVARTMAKQLKRKPHIKETIEKVWKSQFGDMF